MKRKIPTDFLCAGLIGFVAGFIAVLWFLHANRTELVPVPETSHDWRTPESSPDPFGDWNPHGPDDPFGVIVEESSK